MKATRDQIQVFVPPPPGWIWFGKILNWFVVWFADGWTDGFWLTFLWQMTVEGAQPSVLYWGIPRNRPFVIQCNKRQFTIQRNKTHSRKKAGNGKCNSGIVWSLTSAGIQQWKTNNAGFQKCIQMIETNNGKHRPSMTNWRWQKTIVSCTSFYFPIILCFQPSALRIDPEPLPPPNLRKETPSLVTSPSPIHPLEWQTKQ